MPDKLAIIMSGGGMKASFNAGVLLALIDKYKITDPYLLICSSGSAGTGAYYVAKQYDSIKSIWEKLLSSKEVLNRWRLWKILDIDYLIDDIFKKQNPLDEEKVYQSKIKFLISSFNQKTGEIIYFNNRDNMNVFESMRASKAVPIIYKFIPSVKIKRSLYFDPVLTFRADIHLKEAIKEGATKILLINNSPYKSNKLEKIFYKIWLLFQKCRKNYLKTEKELLNYKLPENIKTYTIFPKSKLKIGIIDNDKDSIHQAIDQGYNETLKDKSLESFLLK
jgi:predicted patatin/cPLA2 family phospholipase